MHHHFSRPQPNQLCFYNLFHVYNIRLYLKAIMGCVGTMDDTIGADKCAEEPTEIKKDNVTQNLS